MTTTTTHPAPFPPDFYTKTLTNLANLREIHDQLLRFGGYCPIRRRLRRVGPVAFLAPRSLQPGEGEHMKPGDFVVRLKGSEVLQIYTMTLATELCHLNGEHAGAVSFGDIRPATDIEIAIAVQAEIARTDARLEALRKMARAAFERALAAGRP